MSELLREAIVGTAQSGGRALSLADELVGQVQGVERERALLLCAGVEAVMRRAARVLPQRKGSLPAAEPETLRVGSPSLTAAVRAQLEQEDALLEETLRRMARAGVRLSPELLPLALEQSSPELRSLLRPVLGRRGVWLAQLRPDWAWALATEQGAGALEPDFDRRWAEGTAVERRQLFASLREHDPARARELAAEAWKQERAEQRAAFAEAFALGLSSDDQAFLESLLADRSALVQRIAARLLWRLPGSAVAERMFARARAHVRFELQTRVWQVKLPRAPLDPEWLRDGIAEKPPESNALGPRQWWLLQLIAAVPSAAWLPEPHPGQAAVHSSPRQLVAAAATHELASALLDGLTRAALRDGASDWFAPLWDAWANSDLASTISPDPRVLLSQKLTPPQVAERAAQLVSNDKLRPLLHHLPRPWPEELALRVLGAIADLRLSFREIIPVAALAIPVALLPDALPLPEIRQVDYPLRAYVRALSDFQEIAALRRSIAAETTGDD